jgi:hypothetical protein
LGSGNTTDISLLTGNTVYTNTFRIQDGEYFVVSYKASAVTSSVNATIVVEQSYEPPLVQNSAHASYVTPVSMSDVVTNLTTLDTWYHKAVSFLALPYARFKISGTLLNSTAIVNVKISKQVNG